uniref:Cadherin domain-containing protein n=1 Tax=Anopheles christyi TaxID=43041 RepID=A0A182K5Q1_9DIPT
MAAAASYNGFYFSISKLRVTLPISTESYIILRNEPIVNLRPPDDGGGYKYAIESPPDTDYLKVDPNTGDLWITSQMCTMSNVTEFVIVAVNTSGEGSPYAHGVVPVARLTLTIDPVKVAEDTLDRFCDHHPERACFWDTAQYRVAENEPSGRMIGTVGPSFYRRLCPQHRPRYELLAGSKSTGSSSEYLMLESNNGTLQTKVSFDHDTHAPGPTVQAAVRCTLQQVLTADAAVSDAAAQTVDRTITVNVLDRNDNLPRLEVSNGTDDLNHANDRDDMPSYQVYIDDPHVNQVRSVKGNIKA